MTLSATCSAATTALKPAGVSFARRDGCHRLARVFSVHERKKMPEHLLAPPRPDDASDRDPSMPTPAPAPSRAMGDFTLDILCKDAPGVLQVRPNPRVAVAS